MFGIGGSEILVILIVALLFLGPDKLPDAAKQISKGIRDLKKQSRVLQQTIENDEQIGGAIRDLKSALRGDEIPVRPPIRKIPDPAANTIANPDAPAELPKAEAVTLPQLAGEADPEVPAAPADELAGIIKPPIGEVAARTPESAAPAVSTAPEPAPAPAPAPADEPKQKHG